MWYFSTVIDLLGICHEISHGSRISSKRSAAETFICPQNHVHKETSKICFSPIFSKGSLVLNPLVRHTDWLSGVTSGKKGKLSQRSSQRAQHPVRDPLKNEFCLFIRAHQSILLKHQQHPNFLRSFCWYQMRAIDMSCHSPLNSLNGAQRRKLNFPTQAL